MRSTSTWTGVAIAMLAAAYGCRSDGETIAAGVAAGQSGTAPPAGATATATAGAGGAAAAHAGAGSGGSMSSGSAGEAAAGSAGDAAGGSAGQAGVAGSSAGVAGASTSGSGGVPASAGQGGDAAGAGGMPAAGSSGGPSTPADYAQRGPYQVTIEKNVGENFRNSGVRDETAFCRSFVGGIMLPGEGNVDEELTNYPADMDRQLYTMFRPATFMEGKKYPVVTWGNGTCAQPLLYTEILEQLASHGIIVIATNATSVGSGMEMQRGLDFVIAENARSGSPLFGRVDPALLGASGHSQGSGATVTVGANPRIVVTVPIQGASAGGVRALKGPTFLISGETDTLVTPSSIESAFNAATVPAVYGMSVGQDHLMPGRMPQPILKAVTAWFAIHLLKDEAAKPLFYGTDCGLCGDATWEIEQKNL